MKCIMETKQTFGLRMQPAEKEWLESIVRTVAIVGTFAPFTREDTHMAERFSATLALPKQE